MSVAYVYVILAYKQPQQLARLIRRLSAPEAAFLVHIDRRQPSQVARTLGEAVAKVPNVGFLPSIDTPWSGWGPVAAALIGIERALETVPGVEHVAFLSGQCYPIAPPATIGDFLGEHPGESFMPHWSMPWSYYGKGGGMNRVRFWHRPLGRWKLMVPIPRRLPLNLQPFGGSAFMVLSRQAAAYIRDYTRSNPEVPRYFKHAWACDEHYFQTVLNNSPIKDRVMGDGLWHIDWSSTNSKSPSILTLNDFPKIEQSATRSSDYGGRSRIKLFARKFDASLDDTILDQIDLRLLSQIP